MQTLCKAWQVRFGKVKLQSYAAFSCVNRLSRVIRTFIVRRDTDLDSGQCQAHSVACHRQERCSAGEEETKESVLAEQARVFGVSTCPFSLPYTNSAGYVATRVSCRGRKLSE